MSQKLTPKQEKFCRLVAEGETYAEAYRQSYNASNTTDKVIWVKSSELMATGKVKVRVGELRQQVFQQVIEDKEVDLKEILSAMAKRVRMDLREFFEDDGSFRNIKDLSKDQAMCLSSFDVQEIWGGTGKNREQIGVLKKVKLLDLEKLWDMFMKTFGAYMIKVEHNVSELDHIKEIIGDINDKKE